MKLRCLGCKQMIKVERIKQYEKRDIIAVDIKGAPRLINIKVRLGDRLRFMWHQPAWDYFSRRTYDKCDGVAKTVLNHKPIKRSRQMASDDGQIPMDAGDLPITAPEMEDSLVYTGSFKKLVVNPKASVKGVTFCAIQLEVTEGDFEGFMVPMNYLPLPIYVAPDAPKSQQVKAQVNNQTFGRFTRAFGIKGQIPSVSLTDADSIGRFHEWASQFYEQTGKFTIRNQEFPANSGKQRPGINDFVF